MELEFRSSFLANQSIKAESGPTGSMKASAGTFESTFELKKREVVDTREKERETIERPDSRRARKDDRSSKEIGRDRSERNTVVKEKTQDAVEDDDTGSIEEKRKQVVNEIAEIMGVTPEELVNALNNLSLQPEQLNDPENIKKLAMELKGITDPVELLTIPGFADMLKDVKAVVEETFNTGVNGQIQTPLENDESGNMDKNVKQATDADKTKDAKGESGLLSESDETTIDSTKEFSPEKAVPKTDENAKTHTRTDGKGAESGSGNDSNMNNQGRPPGPMAAMPEQVDAAKPENENTPVVIQKGDETVVEVGGKVVSRAVRTPQSQASDIINQIAEKMKIEFKPTSTEIRINLRPQELGNVLIKIVSESGHVTAEIVAENSKVKELIEGSIDTLKDTLKGQGIDVGELSVSVGQQESDEKMYHYMSGREKSRGRMARIINGIDGEVQEQEDINYVNKAAVSGSSVDFSA